MAAASSKNTDDDRSVPKKISDYFNSDNSSKEWQEKVPVGIRFNPTDEELVGHYLARKVKCQDAGPLSSYIKEVPVYKFDPWQLSYLSSDFGDGKMYFFNKLMRKHWNGEIEVRFVTAGGGSWRMTEPSSPVNDQDGKQIGIKNSLTYFREDQNSGREMKTRWLMNEYRLLNPEAEISKSDPWEWALNVVYSSDLIPDMVGSGSSSSSTPANLDFPQYKQIDDITALHYLSEKAAGRINQHIKQLNVYDFDPGKLSGFAFDSGSGVKCLCFFTHIKTEQKLPKAFNRVAPGGCWNKTGKTSDIIGNDGKPNGIKTSLAYYKIQGSRKRIKTQWLMKEYIYLGNQSNQTETWTLCVIYFHDNKGKQCGSESGLSGDSRTKRKLCETTVSAENPDLQGKRHCLSPDPELHDQNLGINTSSTNTQHFIFSSNNVGTLQQGLTIPNPGQFMSNLAMGACGAAVSNVPVLNQSPFLQAPHVEPCSNFVPNDQLFYTGHQPQPEQRGTPISADSLNHVQFSGDHQHQQQLRENPCSAVATVSTTTDSLDQFMDPDHYFDSIMNLDGDEYWAGAGCSPIHYWGHNL